MTLGSVDPAAMMRLFEVASDMFVVADADGRFVRASAGWEGVLGWSPAEMTALRVADLVHPDDLADTDAVLAQAAASSGLFVSLENRYRTRNGGWRRLLWTACWDGEHWYALAKDVTDAPAPVHSALRDELTDLASRSAVFDRLELALERLRRSPDRGDLVVLFLDLDGFKGVNDSLGHATGDEVLRCVADRLRMCVRATDTLGRMGGDEFVVVAEELKTEADRRALVERVRSAFEAPVPIDRAAVRIGASIGVTVAHEAQTPSDVLREADVAMYRAKSRVQGGAVEVDDAMRVEVRERVALGHDLHGAAQRGELRLLYQPVVALEDRSIVGVEALVRWQHPTRGLLPPGDFISIAEDDDEIVVLGDWVLRTALRQARLWRRAGHDLTIAVNVSPRQLVDPAFPDRLALLLDTERVPAPAVCLEITETAITRDVVRIGDALQAVKGLGVRIALDDFGRGWSSLGNVKQLPVDVIKIDKSFVDGIDTDAGDRAIVAAVISLARTTGLDVVAEGVETTRQARALAELGCEFVQGYHFGRPARARDLDLGGFLPRKAPGVGDPFVIREFMRQIGIPARVR